ncbi:MAG: hypothetical protein KAS18_04660 [Calditrichia bacterium]|nr:hypothetical protein [Calditrichia bacterium]
MNNLIKYKNISRIDSKNTHGWYVRIYLNGGVFASKLFSDRICNGKDKALKNAILYRDHNQMVADVNKQPYKKKRKPIFDKLTKNNKSGIVGVNEVHTKIRNRPVHYIQATWSEDFKPKSKKFYITKFRTREEALKSAIELRKSKEKEILENWNEN